MSSTVSLTSDTTRTAGLRRRLAALVLAVAAVLGTTSVVSVSMARPAEAAVPGVNCSEFYKLARTLPVVWQAGGVALASGACTGYVYSRSPWWNSNFDRIINRCWPRCSPWDFARMMFGIPG